MRLNNKFVQRDRWTHTSKVGPTQGHANKGRELLVTCTSRTSKARMVSQASTKHQQRAHSLYTQTRTWSEINSTHTSWTTQSQRTTSNLTRHQKRRGATISTFRMVYTTGLKLSSHNHSGTQPVDTNWGGNKSNPSLCEPGPIPLENDLAFAMPHSTKEPSAKIGQCGFGFGSHTSMDHGLHEISFRGGRRKNSTHSNKMCDWRKINAQRRKWMYVSTPTRLFLESQIAHARVLQGNL
jgi:hypothetical protein